MLETFVFIFCVCVGSFLNVLIYRLPKSEDFVVKRSYCPNCKHQLAFNDLVPIVSYLFLKGKCRYCHHKISIIYPFIEILSGFIGIYCLHTFGLNIQMYLHFTVLMTLIVISFIDMKIMIIFDSCNLVLVLLSLIRIFLFKYPLYEHIYYACFIALIIWIINRIKLSFGGGDLKLLFSLGLYFGNEILLVFLLSIFLGSIYGFYLLTIKRMDKKSFFPFAPFIALSSFICIFYGNYNSLVCAFVT